jgi:hypothetical protein
MCSGHLKKISLKVLYIFHANLKTKVHICLAYMTVILFPTAACTYMQVSLIKFKITKVINGTFVMFINLLNITKVQIKNIIPMYQTSINS